MNVPFTRAQVRQFMKDESTKFWTPPNFISSGGYLNRRQRRAKEDNRY